MCTPDYSHPLSDVLKESTAEAHTAIENTPAAGWLTRAELDRDEYIRYLMMLWYIYDAFERALTKHENHPIIQPTYNPTLLARAPAIAADIAFLLQIPEELWMSHPIHLELLGSTPPILDKYTARLEAFANSEDPSPLLAHAYVRYLGDLSGGQTIRRRTARAYDLDESTGQGLAFYQFKQLGGSQLATQGDMKKIKEWFRDGLNEGAGHDVRVKEVIAKEASLAFELNSELFSALKPPSETRGPLPLETGGEVVYEYKAPKETATTFSLAGVIAFIAAACMAHLMLVTGGFTGAKGREKWALIDEWFKDYFNNRAAVNAT